MRFLFLNIEIYIKLILPISQYNKAHAQKSSTNDVLYYQVLTNPSIIVIHRLLIYCCQTSLMAGDRVTPSEGSTGALNATSGLFLGML